MMRIPAIVLLVAAFVALTFQARADDAADVTKLAHDFVTALTSLDFDKIEAFGRPQDADSDFSKPPEEVLKQFRDIQNLPQVQDLRRQLADEAAKAISLDSPAFTPDDTCAIVTATPVSAEARKYCVLMMLYTTYAMTVNESKSQGLPLPKVEDIRARILTPGSPEQSQIDAMVASFPKEKLRLQLEKTEAGWRVNLHAFQTAVKALSAETP
jgi:hypothetical protein